MEQLSAGLVKNTNIRKLNLSYNNISDTVLKYLERVFEKRVPKTDRNGELVETGITHLDLSFN